MDNLTLLKVKVWGDLACFTRPEMKVERVSYPVMTPSAARGILEAIFWKPEFSWHVREIWILKPIRYQPIMRNEVNNKVAMRTVKRWAESNGHYLADNHRAQRHTLALRDVAYLIAAQIYLQPHAEGPATKYQEQFKRRIRRGQFWQAPCLGCREFPAYFEEVKGDLETPVPVDDELGLMLFDLEYEAAGDGRGNPKFFQARLEQGILKIPESLYSGEG